MESVLEFALFIYPFVVGGVIGWLIAGSQSAERERVRTMAICDEMRLAHRAERHQLLDRVQSPDLQGYAYRQRMMTEDGQPREASERIDEDDWVEAMPEADRKAIREFLESRVWVTDPRFSGHPVEFDSGFAYYHDVDTFEYAEWPIGEFMDFFLDRLHTRSEPGG